MKRLVIALCVSIPLLNAEPVAAPVKAYAQPEQHLVAPYIMKMWEVTAHCESQGKWHQIYFGSHAYYGGIGIRNDVWIEYGGYETFGAPTAGHATPEQQVFIARRIQAAAGVPNYIPDQAGGCHAW